MLFDTSIIESWLNRSFACDCGKTHEVALKKVLIEQNALAQIAPYLEETGYRHVLVVADRRTFAAAGESLLGLLEAQSIQAKLSLIDDNEQGEVVADEATIVRVMLDLTPDVQAVIAVGSGTIHDMVRFVCYSANRVFISVPTAPSVDGFASVGAPLLIQGFKQTIPACAPEAIFADLEVLSRAPQAMIAAGFGDMLGKYTSLADWELGHLLLEEEYCQLAMEMTRSGLKLCIDHVDEIAAGSKLGVQKLMEGLLLSGISMLIVGNSRPASGAEHQLSHYWEMRFIQQHRKALLHGAKVGVSSLKMAHLYQGLKRFDQEEALQMLEQANPPTAQKDRESIRIAYGSMAEQVIRENFPEGWVEVNASGIQLRDMIAGNWQEIVEIAAQVPEPEQLSAWLQAAGGMTTTQELGVEPALVDDSLQHALFVRNRFTVLRLYRPLGLNPME